MSKTKEVFEQIQDLFNRQKEFAIDRIQLQGSRLQPETVDYWSDTDVLIVLKPGAVLDKSLMDELLGRLGTIIGRDTYHTDGYLKERLVVALGRRTALIDLKVQTFGFWQAETNPTTTESQVKTNFEVQYRREHVDRIWLKFFLCINKFMRNDHLIGLHLLLDLLRDYLVLEMELRDQMKGTNIHRFGDAESLPKTIEPGQIAYQDREATLTYIMSLARTYDHRLLEIFPNYKSRVQNLNSYIANGY